MVGQRYLVITSGRKTPENSSGVGVIIDTETVKNLYSFKCASDRVLTIKLRTARGLFKIVNNYAPTASYSRLEKSAHWTQVQNELMESTRALPRMVVGDMNTRWHGRRDYEKHRLGPYIFGKGIRYVRRKEQREPALFENRELVWKIMVDEDIIFANSFFQKSNSKRATYRDIGTRLTDQICPTEYGQLDHYYISRGFRSRIQNIQVRRHVSLPSRHFPVEARLRNPYSPPKKRATVKKQRINRKLLTQKEFKQNYLNTAKEELASPGEERAALGQTCDFSGDEAEQLAGIIYRLMSNIQEIITEDAEEKNNEHWRSAAAKAKLAERDLAREQNDEDLMRELDREYTKICRKDKIHFLEETLASDTWDTRRVFLPNKKKKSKGALNLKRENGVLGESSEKEEIMARFLKNVLWKKRDSTSPPISSRLRDLEMSEIDVCLDRPFTVGELNWALRRLKNNKSNKPSKISCEEWKAVCCIMEMEDEIVRLFNFYFVEGQFIDRWRFAEVISLYKKGDATDPENYRLVALLGTLYKIMSRIVTKRILDHAESRMRATQFGFREKQGRADALLAIRIILERVARVSEFDATLLFLDWKKAFDSVAREAALLALENWGIPGKLRKLVSSMLESEFEVIGPDNGRSQREVQDEGLRTGDPLSTVLFIVTLAWVLKGVDQIERELHPAELLELDTVRLIIRNIIYADDTTMTGTILELLQHRLSTLEYLAAPVGLNLSRKKSCKMIGTINIKATRGESRHGPNRKVEAPPLRFADAALAPEDSKQELLGSQISRSLRIREEIKRRANLGRERIKEIAILWQGTGISKKRKVQLFEIYIGTKVCYSLETLNFIRKEYEYVDALQMHMIRIVTKTPPTFTTEDEEERHHLPNAALRERYDVKPWSHKVKDARRREFQRTVNRTEEHPTYKAMFSSPGTERIIRARKYPGRPVGNGQSWIHNTCQKRGVSVEEEYDLAKRGAFYI